MPTVLYAEDDRDCRELFAFVLRLENYYVYEAMNGAQAVQIVRDERPDLVVLDARMPMMSGYDAAQIIGREAPHIPILFLSSRGLHHEVQKAFECGPNVVDYLLKPVTPSELMQRVRQVLQDARTQGLEAIRHESLAREGIGYVQL